MSKTILHQMKMVLQDKIPLLERNKSLSFTEQNNHKDYNEKIVSFQHKPSPIKPETGKPKLLFMKTSLLKSGSFAILFLIVNLFFAGSVFGQTTYTWNQTGTASWTTTTNWTPTRTTPAANDILQFSNGATTTVTNIPTQTIGQLLVSGSTTVNLQAAGANTLTIGNITGTDLSVASGSALNINGANALAITLPAGATGSIIGNMTFSNAAHTLNANDASAITFSGSAIFTQGTGSTGNPFTAAGTANVIVFASGTQLVSNAGANPFGLAAPASKVVFQTGSLYKLQQNATPSVSGRTYANFENNVAATIPFTGTGALSIDNLTVTQGTITYGMTGTPGHSIKGNISVASGATLNFSPLTAGTVNLNGSSLQTITGTGTIASTTTNSTISIPTGSSVSLQTAFSNAGTFGTTGTGTLAVTSTGTYTHNRDAGIIPTASWDAASTCNITGTTNNLPGGLTQTAPGFGNFTWNCTNQNNDMILAIDLNIQGTFTLTNTGGNDLILTDNNTARTFSMANYSQATGTTFRATNSGTGAATISISGSYSQNGGEFRGNNSTGSCTVSVGGNFSLSGNALFNLVSGGANSSTTVNGNVTIGTGTTLRLSEQGGQTGTLSVKGNFSHAAGSVTVTNGGTGAIVFSGTSPQIQTYTSGGTLSGLINYTVNTGSTLQMGTAAVPATISNGSTGTFTLQAGATLGITSPLGITTTGATGNIQSSGTRTYTAGANYIYNGAANQAAGNGLTQNTPNNIEIANTGLTNSNTVSLSATLPTTGSTTGYLKMTSGILNLNGFSATVGDLQGSANIANTGGVGTYTLTAGSDNSSTTYSGVISNATGTVNLTKTGTGTLTLSGVNTYTGLTTINTGGVLQLGIANAIKNGASGSRSNVVISGGTLKSGSGAGFSDGSAANPMGTLQVSTNTSIINLGTGDHSLFFAASNGTWPAGTLLTINNWTGSGGATGAAGKIFIGNTTGTLNAGQLSQISFTGYSGTPILLNTGELVPPSQAPVLAVTGTLDNGVSCIGIAASPKTYTITNTGFTAASGITISVVPNDLQFVVSNLSSTTIAANGGTATYQVTFKPASSGPHSASVTVSSTTSGSNSPTTTVTGNGNDLPQGSLLGNTICSTGTGQLTFTSTSGTGPFALVINGVSYPSVTSGVAVNGNPNPSGTTNYLLNSITDANGCVRTTSSITGASATITVYPNASVSSVTGNTTPLCIGGTTTFTANDVVLGGTGTGAWSSSNPAIATVDANGVVTAVSEGTADIIYTITGGCNGTASAQLSISVYPNASVSSVTGNTTPLCIGGTTTFTANDVVLGGTGTGAWSSSNPAIATVDANGVVTAVSEGTADIIYTITGGCNGTASAQLSISVYPNASVSSVTGNTTPLCIGGTTTFTANDVVLGGTGTGAWSSSNPAIATVDANGVVTAVSEGTADIIYTITGGCNGTASAQLSISVYPNASVSSVTGNTTPLCIGGTTTFTANDVVLGGTGTGAWSSSNPAIATVDANGVVTAASEGTADIIYTITGSCNGTASAQLSISVYPNASVSSVTGNTTPLCIGGTTTFTANDVVLGGTGTGAWSSSNPAIATVDANGVVTAASEGTADIIYTITGGCNGTASAQLSISVYPNASVSSVTGNTTPLCIGGTTTFTANDVVLGGTGTGAWSSSNPAIATVDANGVVTAASEGTADIIYTITGGCNGTASAQLSISVYPNASVSSVTGNTTPLCIGGTTTFTANDVVLGGTGTGAWSSSNPAIATVDANGVVTAVSEGTADIIYTITGGCNGTASAQLSISVYPNASVSSVTGNTTPLCIGGTTTFTANDVVLGGTGTGAWSSSNPAIATVDANGVVTAVSEGTADIIYTITGGCNGTASAQLSISVYPNASVSSVTGNTTPLCIGGTTTFTANDVVLGGTGTGAWSSSNPAIATVDANGVVTAVSEGTADIIYTITGGCNGTASAQLSISVNANSTISLTSAGADVQTICIDNTVNSITYLIGGGATGATVAGLPVDVTGTYNPSTHEFTISGTATVAGVFNFVVTTTGPCFNTSLNGTITVNTNSAISLSSAVGTNIQTVCINTPVSGITYGLGGSATGATVTGLPAGVTGSYSSGVLTISGTPTESGVFSYTVTTTGPCINTSLSGTITVNANSTISLSSASGTNSQTVCINNAITNITYAIGGGGTGASITAGALPAGVTGVYSAGVFTISGTPTVSGTFSYTVTTTGPCINTSLSGTITVNANSTIILSSAAGTNSQTVCINNAITNITYAIGSGGTGASITAGALPSGVTGVYNAGVFTISGTPTVSGTFNYTVTTTGPCINASLSGTITVNANSTITLSSGPATQNTCINGAIIPASYTIGGGGTGASITAGALPAGVTGVYSAGVFTISGTPTVSGTFNYTVTTSGPCSNASLSGTITVNPSPVVNAVSNAAYCNNAPGAAVTFSTSTPGGPVTYNWTSTADIGFGTSGAGNIPGFTAVNNTTNVITATVSVTATINGCTGAATSFTITVSPSPAVNAISNLTYCANTPGAAITFSSPTTGGTVTYNWTSTVNVGFGLNGTGNIAAFTATNNSINPLITTVTVTPVLNGCTGTPVSFTITVNPNANSGSISGSNAICAGTSTQLSANGNTGGVWSSSTPAIASVNPATGLVTGLSAGSTTIFYTVTGSCGASSASFSITVNPVPSAGTITGANTVCAGSSVLLSTNGTPGGSWLSASPNATVNAIGLVTGVTPGTATIFYFVSNSCGSSFTSYNITVNPGASAGTISGSSSICQNTTTQLFTSGTSGGVWSSSNPSVAFIDGTSGIVFGLNPGTTTITYTVTANSCSSGSTATFSLAVNPAGNAGVITGPTNVCVGSSILLTASGSSGGTWISGSPSATVNSLGLVTGVSQGSATIYYFVSNSCGSSFATYNVAVSPVANAGTISGSANMCVASPNQLSTNGTPGGVWTSNNPSVFVDGNGLVLAFSAGTAKITYTVTTLCATSSSSFNITVNPVPTAGTVSGATSVCAGLSTTFSSTGGTPGGTWSSSNTAAATVNATTGVVTGVAAGNATITYTLITSCGIATASAPITVNPVLNAGTVSGGSSVCIGSTVSLSASGNSGGTWSSSAPGVATIDINSGLVTGLTAGNATMTYSVSNSCGTSTATKLVTVNALANAGTISGAASVCTGLSTTFTSNGMGSGTWSSSNTAVASVNGSTGVITGVAAGTATITYTVTTTCGTASTSADITVNPQPNAGTISGPASVCANAFINLSTTGIAGGTWASSTPGVATVSSSGKVTGVTAGVTTITYSVTTGCGTNVASYNITVNPFPNAGTVSGPASVCVNSSVFLTNTGGDLGGIWGSSNTARATVDQSAKITGVSAGNAIITYNVSNSCGSSTASMVIFVNSLPDAGTISGPSSVCTGASINLNASGNTGGTWTSNTPGVATVNASTGVVTGVSAGNATIIYTVGSAALCGTSSATYLVTVNPLANAGSISGTTAVCAGLSSTLTSNGSVGGTWSSSNPSVASVNSTSGVVTGLSAGNTTISYTVTNVCGSATASATFTVNPVANAGTISGASSVCVGSNIILSSNISGGTWSSSSTAVATIDANTGTITGVAAGNTTITYTVTTVCGTASATYAVTVNPVPNAGTISGTTFVCTGATTTLSSNIPGGTWSSSNTTAATVNPTTGVVSGLAAGSTTITYTISSVCGVSTATAVVTVGSLPNAGTVSGNTTLCAGSTAVFTSNGTGGGTWSSNNTAAATVNPTTGVVTGVAAGSATITYTVSGTCGSSSSSANITISALANAGTITGASTICAGSTTTFTSNGTSGGSWSSNNNLVATVNASTGVITAVAAGSATITYTVTNTCGTATATANITVNPLPDAGTVSGATSLCSGLSTAFSSTGTGAGTWSSNNTAVATVDAGTGLVTAVAAGSATITYTVGGSCGTATASANITILSVPNAGTVSGANSVCAGATIALTSNGAGGGSWSSNNTAAATVNPTTGVVTGVAGGSAIISYSLTNTCGTTSATQLVTVIPLPDAGTVSGTATVCIGSTTTYSSSGLSGGTWSSSNTAVATVNASTGLITGVSTGNATITYTVTTGCGTASSSALIGVITLPNAGTVSGANAVCVGATTTYSSNGVSGGTWSSGATSVATVNASTGVITGIAAGTAVITYEVTNACGTSTSTKTITVDPLANAGTVSGAATVCVNAQTTFTTNGLSGGSWSSSNPAVATINTTTGVVTGVAAGTATITYTSTTPCGTATATATISVTPIANAGVISGNTNVCTGATTTYTSNGLTGGTWSSATPSVATVNASTGVITAVSAGTSVITYTVTGCGTASATKTITVDPLPNAGTVSGAATLCQSSTTTYVSNGSLSGGSWSSSNPAVASVNPTSGVVTGVAGGTATITYTSTTPCGTQTSSASITINPLLTTGTVSGSATLCIGSTTTYTSNGSPGGVWSSSNTAVATVHAASGVITGIATGNANITYTVTSGCGTFSASKTIAVSVPANPGTLGGATSVCAGSTATITRSGGVSGGTWTSSNTAVATVNNAGVVTGISTGNATITYTVSAACGTSSTTRVITVSAPPSITATNMTVSTDPGECSALVTLGSNVTVTGSPVTLEYRIGVYIFSFPINQTFRFYRGTTPVTVVASNSCGTVARVFFVTVEDNQAPTLTCVPNATRVANGSGKYSVRGHEFDVTASDGCGVASLMHQLSGATVEGYESGPLSNDKLNIGVTTITWRATDVNGNVSTCTTQVTVTGSGGRPASSPFTVSVAPNPSIYMFTLKFNNVSNENMKLFVTDASGRVVEQKQGIAANSTLQLGHSYHPGIYFVEIIQGSERQKLKLIKAGN